MSILQQFLDMIYSGVNGSGWSFFGSGDGFNIVKFFLGVFAWFFDIIFLFQHFVLYRGNHDPSENDEENYNGNKKVLLSNEEIQNHSSNNDQNNFIS